MSAWLRADWPAPAGVHALTTVRHGLGVSAAPFDALNLGNHRSAGGDDAACVQRNRALLIEHLGLPSPPCWLRQVHGTDVVRFSTPPPAGAGGGWERVLVGAEATNTPLQLVRPSRDAAWRSAAREAGPRERVASAPANRGGGDSEPEADASVTSTPGVVLAILTADCLPVVFASRNGDEVGAAHAGWRGLAAGVLEATVQAMHTDARDLVAWLGPAAGPRSYEIGMEVYDAFVAQEWRDGAAFTSTRPRHWRVDLYALARRRLVDAGLDPAHVHGGDCDTIADPARFFSHRRDGRTGRMTTLAWVQR